MTRLPNGAQLAEAAYIPGQSQDTIDTNLTVQGPLIVSRTDGSGNVGLGTATPQGRLDVVLGPADSIRVGGFPAIGSDRIGRQCYYSPAVAPASPTGKWAAVASYAWNGLSASYTWDGLTSLEIPTVPPTGSWGCVVYYSWNALRGSYTWQQLATLPRPQ